MELTKQQEDCMLEQDRDEEREGTVKELFNDFLSDNITQLRADFTEQYEEEWLKFCKESFDVWFEDYKYSNNK